VVAVDRGRYTCVVGDRAVTAMRARELGRRAVVVGDRVAIVGDTSGEVDALARIVRLHPRRTVLRRTADDNDPVERVVVANAEQLVIVTALADPPPRVGFVDRCLVAAFDAGLQPLLCLTKGDLAGPEDLLRLYRELAVTAVTTRPDVDPEDLRTRLAGRVSVFIGHSGVGKSTLVNRLVPDAGRATGIVNVVTGRGRHTSSDGWSTRPVCGRSDWLTYVLPTCSPRSPIWLMGRPAARLAASTWPRAPAARWTSGYAPGMPRPPGWSPTAGCCTPA